MNPDNGRPSARMVADLRPRRNPAIHAQLTPSRSVASNTGLVQWPDGLNRSTSMPASSMYHPGPSTNASEKKVNLGRINIPPYADRPSVGTPKSTTSSHRTEPSQIRFP